MNWLVGAGVLIAGGWIFLAYAIGSVIDRNDKKHFWKGMYFWCAIPAAYLLWVLVWAGERWLK
jgi:membrane protein DedA with SNARE-associated domain